MSLLRRVALSVLKRKAKPLAVPASPNPASRNRQQNIKVSEDCAIVFDAMGKKLGMSKSELFEDMVAERYDALRRKGIELDMAGG